MIRQRVKGLMLVVALCAVIVNACGSSGYEYVTNKDKGLYLKIPDSWQQVPLKVDNSRPDNVFTSRPWQVLIDSAASASPSHFDDLSAEVPVGKAVILPLETNDPRDGISVTWLRSGVLAPIVGDNSIDPLALISDGNNTIELIDYKELSDDSGYWGTHIVVNVRVADDKWMTIGEIAETDTSLSNLYRLTVLCESSCYEDHLAEIDRIFDSWTLEKR